MNLYTYKPIEMNRETKRKKEKTQTNKWTKKKKTMKKTNHGIANHKHQPNAQVDSFILYIGICVTFFFLFQLLLHFFVS